MNTRPPFLLRSVFPGSVWRIPSGSKRLYLTFDDGPLPEVTSFVLDELDKVNAKATFFCIGKNAQAHPEFIKEIRMRGHSIGNHSFNHEKGWETKTSNYLNSVDACNEILKTPLFRPPYGKISPLQFVKLRRKYRFVFWDVLAYDYDERMTGTQCIDRVMKASRDGSIITMHDSKKAWPRLKVALPIILRQLTDLGFSFLAIPEKYNLKI